MAIAEISHWPFICSASRIRTPVPRDQIVSLATRSSYCSARDRSRAQQKVRKTRIKWKLWHGNTTGAQEVIEDLEAYLLDLEVDYPNLRKFVTAAREFAVYIASNVDSLINYGERYRSGERISSAFVEATVNAVVSKRFAKKQQMQWTRRGAHLLLQTRTKTLDGTLRPTFERWYPGLADNDSFSHLQAEAA